MKKKYERSKFIKTLEDAPFVSYAAKKVGISRATIYRWMNSNQEFREAVNVALDSGRNHVGDIAEMSLVELIKSKNLAAIKFFLQHNNRRYLPMRTGFIPPPQPKPLANGETCGACGFEKYDTSDDAVLRELYIETAHMLGLKVVESNSENKKSTDDNIGNAGDIKIGDY
jgi:hypothetical protein